MLKLEPMVSPGPLTAELLSYPWFLLSIVAFESNLSLVSYDVFVFFSLSLSYLYSELSIEDDFIEVYLPNLLS